MYKLVVDYVNSHIEPGLPTEVGTRLFTTLRYHPDGYEKTWSYIHKKSDGYVYLYNVMTQQFRTGLL